MQPNHPLVGIFQKKDYPEIDKPFFNDENRIFINKLNLICKEFDPALKDVSSPPSIFR